jgi:hypothetical protein
VESVGVVLISLTNFNHHFQPVVYVFRDPLVTEYQGNVIPLCRAALNIDDAFHVVISGIGMKSFWMESRVAKRR